MIQRMLTRMFSVLALSLMIIVFFSAECRAEGAGDFFLYDVKRLPKNILVDSIGVITIVSEEFKEGIRFYQRENDRFAPAGIIQVENTFPASEGGYGGWCKYLVTRVSGEYAEIITDPYRDFRIWIKTNNKPDAWGGLIIFDKLDGKALKHEMLGEIDIFILSNEIKLYREPEESEGHLTIRKELQERRVFYPVSFRDGFIQIGREFFDDDTIKTTYSDPIGWIKARDGNGAITFYLYSVSWL